jgi:hypothetical protein
MGIFRDRYGDLHGRWVLFLIFAVPTVAIIGGVIAAQTAWVIGVEETITGTVQLHRLRYDKFWKVNFTEMELRTFSGDTHHLVLYGHWPQLENGNRYRITFVIKNLWGNLFLINHVVSVEELT